MFLAGPMRSTTIRAARLVALRKLYSAVAMFHDGSSSACCSRVMELLRSMSSLRSSLPQTTAPTFTRLLGSKPYSLGTMTSPMCFDTSQTGLKLIASRGWWIRSKRTASRISGSFDTFQTLCFLSQRSSRSFSQRRWTSVGFVTLLQSSARFSMSSSSLHKFWMCSCSCLKLSKSEGTCSSPHVLKSIASMNVLRLSSWERFGEDTLRGDEPISFFCCLDREPIDVGVVGGDFGESSTDDCGCSGWAVMRSYNFCFCSSISGSAPEGRSSSIIESVSTSATQIGVREPPSKSKRPRAKAAADICTRPSSEL
mmetsp:Transcript_44184/g.127617  ORF Transcript_44184/g.127617 Transcript_44184/m.127617 type:complete len:311 (-) Transcript_44184:1800-2732(-)